MIKVNDNPPAPAPAAAAAAAAAGSSSTGGVGKAEPSDSKQEAINSPSSSGNQGSILESDIMKELDYPSILNAVLPPGALPEAKIT